MNGMIGDFFGAGRVLTRRPGYALIVVATLALGIAAVTAVFALLDGVLLRPLPLPDADRLLLVRNQNAQGDWNTSVVDVQAIAAQHKSFDAVAAMRAGDMLLAGDGEGEWVSTRSVTADFFRVMGVQPARGRGFQPGEDRAGAARTAVLGHAFAARRFGAGDPLGRTITLDGNPHVVVGVMPPGAETLPALSADLWPVLQLAEPTRRGPFFLSTLARMKEGVTLEQARDDLAAISARIFPLWQAGFQDETARLAPRLLRDAVVRNTGDFLWLAFAAVLAVLAIAMVNVANLTLMRVTERAQDLAVRAALGASARRLGRLVVAESLVLAALGGALGIALAAALLELYRALGPSLPRLAEVGLDARAAAFAGAATLVCGIVCGAVPLLFDGIGRGAAALQPARGTSAGRRQQLVRDGLVTLEFALALPLLVTAGLLVGSLVKLQQVDPGFEAERLLTLRARLLETAHPDQQARFTFWERAKSELGNVPGVVAVGLAGTVPPSCGCYNNFDIVGRPAVDGNQPQSPWVAVDAGYFAALGTPLIEGRGFAAQDTPESPPVVLVSESWAKRYFPGESAVGKRLYEGGNTEQFVTVIGVVGDTKFDGLENPGEVVYGPMSQGWQNNPAYLYVRTATEPLALVEPVSATLRRLDPALVPDDVAPMTTLLGDSLGNQRHWAAVIAGFALAAALLAAIGVFGVLAYYVARRQREIGVRLALGADARGIVALVMRRGLACAAAGAAVGMVLALFLTRGLESLLFRIERLDPVNLAGASTLLLAVALAACWLPARRAARIDPMVALRHE